MILVKYINIATNQFPVDEVTCKLQATKSKGRLPPNKSLEQDVSVGPWRKLTTGIYNFDNTSYLLIMDYYLYFPLSGNWTAKHVVAHM